MIRRNRGLRTAALLALGTLAFSGCETDLTEINANPNAPEVVPLNNVLLRGVWDVANNSAERGYFGRWVMLSHAGNWAQHIAQPVYNEEDKYIPRADIEENIWNEMYTALTDLNEAKQLAEEAGNDNAWAVAEVMTVAGFALLTDYFGDIPYSEALSLDASDVISPGYDVQADIYPDLIARLTAAAAKFDVTGTIGFEGYDPVYQGDVDGWEMFANSLRLRLAMRMVNATPAAAQAAFEAAWASDIFMSVDDEATVDWVGTYPSANPTWRALVYGGRSGDFRMSESLIDRLIAFDDPRLDIYAVPAVSDGVQRGLRNGRLPSQYAPALVTSDFSTIGAEFMDPAHASVFMSYAEVLFLGAEAAELGWNVGGATSAQLYADGIEASMEEQGVDAADIAAYLAQTEVGLTTGTYRGVDAIRVQKWISLYMQGPEAFSDLRRYGWDWTTQGGTTGADLVVAENSVLTAGVYPARLPYPKTENLYNSNAPPDVDSYTLEDKLWWAQ